MKTIAVISQKGGAGKTTLAAHLAVASTLGGYATGILDLDPQASAEAWGGWRKDAPPEVRPAKAVTLPRIIPKMLEAKAADVVIFDTPGAAAAEAMASAEQADLILIPCRPRALDLDAIRQTAALARGSRKPAFLVFNATGTRPGPVRADALAVAAALGLEVAPVRLAERAAFHRAMEEGKAAQEIEPNGKAALEIEALWGWVCDRLSMPSRKTENVEV